ncbi:MAG TPA: M3 family metallopeptidase, partial [Polyangiaceae bacterium]|nr:M3 family metallopeptidase [Polyangiaceae bacterium]
MENPLVSVAHPVPFDRIAAENVPLGLTTLVSEAQAAIDRLSADSSPATWGNTLAPLEASTERLEIATAVVEHLEGSATTPELRRVYMETLPITTAFWTNIPLNPGLYRRLRELAEVTKSKPLIPVQQRLLDKTLDEFRRHGAELNPEGKARLAAIDEALGRLTAEFSQAAVDATSAWELVLPDASRLTGLPETALDMARDNARAKGLDGYRLTLATPCVIAVLTYASDRSLREQIWRANDTRCSVGAYDNVPRIEQILALRREKAHLLGFACFGDLVMADRMAKCEQRARDFILELTARTEPAFRRECDELREFARQAEADSAFNLQPWDLSYYAELLRKKKFEFDDELLRVYFPAEKMLEAVFETSSELFGIRIALR